MLPGADQRQARLGPVLGRGDQAGTQRVPLDVADDGEQVAVVPELGMP